MAELVDDMARRMAAAMRSADWDRTVDPAEVEEDDLDGICIDAILDPRALARLMARELLAAQRATILIWDKYRDGTEVDEFLAYFAHEHGLADG